MTDPFVGRTIGNFVLSRKVGEGGMGAVYLGEHNRISRRAAIKVLLPELAAEPEVVARFLNEARASADIKHPHVIEISDFGELDDGTSYLVMEWLEGRSLADRMGAARVPVTLALHIGRQIAEALEAAHRRGVVHRDLKPDNVFLVERDGDADFVKVLDFGIAKILRGATELHTQTGTILGTPGYMSPEQCRGEVVDPRADLYALGVILYEMLGGRLPFEAEGLGELLYLHANVEPPPLGELLPHVGPAVAELVHRALAKNPAARWPSARALGEAIGAALTGAQLLPATATATKPGADDAFAATLLPGPQPNPAELGQARTLAPGAAATPSPTAPRKPRRKQAGVLAGSAALAALALGAWRYSAHGAAPIVAASPLVKAPAPPAPAPAPPVTPLVAPTSAQLHITTSPAGAQLLIDDAPVENPFAGTFARSSTAHTVEVRAAGYRAEQRSLILDGDTVLAITLHAHVKEDAPKAPVHVVKNGGRAPGNEPPTYHGVQGTLMNDYPGAK